MSFSGNNITLAITVYDRRQYIKQAVASALEQTVAARVIVVEDCGPDASLESFVKREFGNKIDYIRNARRRGLFGNWNACLELCPTEWVSILHDDDYLAPRFVEAMIELREMAPGRGLYYGITIAVDGRGNPIPEPLPPQFAGKWEDRGLKDIQYAPNWFAGHLFEVSRARRVGSFRETSLYAGDWEMWAKLIADGGAAQANEILAYARDHEGLEKGTNKVVREGRHFPLTYVQHKRVLALLRKQTEADFNRAKLISRCPVPTQMLLRYGRTLRPRLLHYHARLYQMAPPPHWRYALFQLGIRYFGLAFVKATAWILR